MKEEILKIIDKELKQAQIDYDAYPDCQTSTRLSTLKDIKSKVSQMQLPVKPATCGQYLFELQKRYIEIREGFAKDPHTFWVTDEMYMIGQILNQYGVQKDKLPLTVDAFIKQQSKLSV